MSFAVYYPAAFCELWLNRNFMTISQFSPYHQFTTRQTRVITLGWIMIETIDMQSNCILVVVQLGTLTRKYQTDIVGWEAAPEFHLHEILMLRKVFHVECTI